MAAKIGFKVLAKDIEKEYKKKGKSAEEAKKIGAATAAKIGMEKFGKKGMAEKAAAGKAKAKRA
jgi:hypothetical protein